MTRDYDIQLELPLQAACSLVDGHVLESQTLSAKQRAGARHSLVGSKQTWVPWEEHCAGSQRFGILSLFCLPVGVTLTSQAVGRCDELTRAPHQDSHVDILTPQGLRM